MTVRNIANIDRPSFIAELSSVSEFSSVENANQFCDFLRTVIDKHAPPSLWKVITHKSSHWFESIRDELFIAKRERRQAERKWRNTKLTIFKDLYRQAKHKVSKLVHTAKCKSELLHSMQSCISNVKAWATANMLKLNDNKTELMLVTSKRIKHLHNLPTSITIGNAQVPFKQSLKNLGFTLDCHLTMNAYVTNIARTCYFELRRLASIRRFLTSTATATLVSAFVLSRIDYCSSLLFGSTHDVTSHLQRIQDYAARVILRLPMSSSITIHLKSLRWLPVKVRSTYKIACLCYHCHISTAPSYVTDMLHK